MIIRGQMDIFSSLFAFLLPTPYPPVRIKSRCSSRKGHSESVVREVMILKINHILFLSQKPSLKSKDFVQRAKTLEFDKSDLGSKCLLTLTAGRIFERTKPQISPSEKMGKMNTSRYEKGNKNKSPNSPVLLLPAKSKVLTIL